jgi:hypothetical protein
MAMRLMANPGDFPPDFRHLADRHLFVAFVFEA